MYPILFEVPRPSAWGAALIVTVLLLLALAIELREQRRGGAPLSYARLFGVAAVAAVAGLLLSAALARWGPVPVRSWGTMLMLGFTAAMLWTIWDARNDKQFDADFVIDITLAILIGAIVGARVLSVVLNWDHYSANPGQLMRLWAGGLSFHGGLIGGLLAGSLLTWHRGVSVLRTMDVFAPSIALGYAITRIGCFLNGCCHGHPTESAFGVYFPHIANAGTVGIDLHPAQLYASAASLMIFGILLAIRRYISRPGQLFGAYLLIYSGARFIIEEFRRNASGEVFTAFAPLTIAQVASIGIALVIAGLMLFNHLRMPPGQQAPESQRTSGESK